MQTSTEVAELFAALATAQGKFTDIVKDKKARIESQKGSYGYAFADLASYIEAIRPALAEAKLAVIQAPAISAGTVTVTTRIVHASGQWVESELTMPVGQQTPQGIGSAITYARRYALAPMLCLAADDDDGEQAERAVKRQATYTPQFQAPAAAPNGQPEPVIAQAETTDLPRLTDWQRKALHAAGAAYYGKTWDDKRHDLVRKVTKGRTQSSADLTPDEANVLIDGINRKANEDAAAAALTALEADAPF